MQANVRHLVPTAGIDAGHGLVVTVAADDRIILWDGAAGRPLAQARHDGLARSCNISRSGRFLVTAGDDGCARIWSIQSLRIHSVLSHHPQQVESAMFSPDESRVLTASRDRYVRIFRLTGELLRTVSGQAAEIVSVEWAGQGGQLVISTCDATISVWDSGTGLLISTVKLIGENPVTVTVADRNAFYVGDSEGKITFIVDGSRYIWPAHDAAVSRVRYYAACKLVVSSGEDNTVRFWECRQDGTLVVTAWTEAPPQVLPWCFARLDCSTCVFGTTNGDFAAFDRVTGRWRLGGER